MANEHDVRNDEEQFQIAFAAHTSISPRCRSGMLMIKNNVPDMINFTLGFNESDSFSFSDLAWELLGRYISNNDYLKSLDLSCLDLTDELMAIIFNSLVKSSSLQVLILNNNRIGMNGIRSMIPFLKNASNLSLINLSDNEDICTEEFEVLINALDGEPIETLNLNSCNIKDISVLGNCTLPNLRELHLENSSVQNMGDISALQNYTNPYEF